MKITIIANWNLLILVTAMLLSDCHRPTPSQSPETGAISESAVQETIRSLKKKFGDAHADRITRGVQQAARLWWKEDGDEKSFTDFCMSSFITDPVLLDRNFERFEKNLMLIDGYMVEIGRDLSAPLQLDRGPMLPVDQLFGEFSPSVHVGDDLFKTRVAFTALLNFPVTTLEQRLKDGPGWTRRQWAEARLADRFSVRVPSDVNQVATSAYTAADSYINGYNIFLGNVLNDKNERLFPAGLKLISHWGLRDELKSQYSQPGGLDRQRMIQKIMERIIRQEIPRAVIDNPDIDWNVEKNTVAARPDATSRIPEDAREPDTRYQHWLNIFRAEMKRDAFYGTQNFIDRKFDREREIPEKEVEALLVSVLQSPVLKDLAAFISRRLARPLEPFDIWYKGLQAAPAAQEDILDQIVSKRYPTVEAFQNDVPTILRGLGFSAEKAAFLSQHIVVDPSRGAGHAMGAGRTTDQSHLRTRVGVGGMNYKGYNIAIHELGHNVEQTFSFQSVDHTLLRGVPNTAFTECFAFLFQAQDLALLGMKGSHPNEGEYHALDLLWSTYEIAGVALTDMRAWRWLYAHPDATPEQFKQAVIESAVNVWNNYYAPVLGMKDVPLLAIYSHMIDGGMYTPDYPLGHIISFQLEQYMRTRKLSTEMERMCRIGSLSPDLWMREAVGAPISTAPLLEAAQQALANLKEGPATVR